MTRVVLFQRVFRLECLRALNTTKVLRLATRPVKDNILVLMVNTDGKKFIETIPAAMVLALDWKAHARHAARTMIAQVYPRYCGNGSTPTRGMLYPVSHKEDPIK